eukprot:GHVO01017095.1.p1 GENE.GHVO01017095.1~~GHVO01017095.1.p1  ORF type:complete len:313 (+),score=34.35 GHVO01017095.1:22-939(+)
MVQTRISKVLRKVRRANAERILRAYKEPPAPKMSEPSAPLSPVAHEELSRSDFEIPHSLPRTAHACTPPPIPTDTTPPTTPPTTPARTPPPRPRRSPPRLHQLPYSPYQTTIALALFENLIKPFTPTPLPTISDYHRIIALLENLIKPIIDCLASTLTLRSLDSTIDTTVISEIDTLTQSYAITPPTYLNTLAPDLFLTTHHTRALSLTPTLIHDLTIHFQPPQETFRQRYIQTAFPKPPIITDSFEPCRGIINWLTSPNLSLYPILLTHFAAPGFFTFTPSVHSMNYTQPSNVYACTPLWNCCM